MGSVGAAGQEKVLGFFGLSLHCSAACAHHKAIPCDIFLSSGLVVNTAKHKPVVSTTSPKLALLSTCSTAFTSVGLPRNTHFLQMSSSYKYFYGEPVWGLCDKAR